MADPVIAPPKFPLNGEREKNGEIALRLSLFHSKQPFSRIERCKRTSCGRNLNFGQGAERKLEEHQKGGEGGEAVILAPVQPRFTMTGGIKTGTGDGFSATFSWIQNFPLSFSSSLVELFPNYCEFIIKDLKGNLKGNLVVRERNVLSVREKWKMKLI